MFSAYIILVLKRFSNSYKKKNLFSLQNLEEEKYILTPNLTSSSFMLSSIRDTKKIINTRKENKALLTGSFRRDWSDCTAQRRKQVWSCLGMSIHMSSITLSPKQHACEGAGKWQHREYQIKRQWDQAQGKLGVFLWNILTLEAIGLDMKVYRTTS